MIELDGTRRLIDADDLIETLLDRRRTETETIPKLIRLINAQPTVEPSWIEKELDEWCADCKEYDLANQCCPRLNRVIREALNEVEPKRGRWMPDFVDKDIRNGMYFFCSECGEEMPPSKVFYPYCPNCGARMEE